MHDSLRLRLHLFPSLLGPHLQQLNLQLQTLLAHGFRQKKKKYCSTKKPKRL